MLQLDLIIYLSFLGNVPYLADFSLQKISQKQPFTQFTQIFRGRNQFFRTPRVNLHKNDYFLFDFHISAWLNRLISRFTQIPK